jgi:predicted dehydrogenase
VSQPLPFLIVGAGAIAQAYLQALRAVPGARLAGVVDVRPEAAQAAAEALGARAFISLDEALRDGTYRAAIVCTPPVTHPAVTLRLVEKGIHVLCEKPLAIDMEGARRMVSAAQAQGVVLTMATKFRYVDDVIEAKSIVTSGILGDLILLENSFTAFVDMSKRWNSDRKQSGGGVVIDNGTHSVDLVRYFLGPIAEVQAVKGPGAQGPDVEDSARLFLRSAGAVMAAIDLSWTLNKDRDTYIEIYGSAGVVRVGWKESRYRHASSPAWLPFGRGYDKVAAFRKQVENFCGAIRGEEPLLVSTEDAMASVQVIEAAYQSLAHPGWVPVGGKAGQP